MQIGNIPFGTTDWPAICRTFRLTSGMSYQVADGAEPHRSHTAKGARLFIVD